MTITVNGDNNLLGYNHKLFSRLQERKASGIIDEIGENDMKRTKPQMNHIKWLNFAISLSQMDLDNLTAGQKLDLKDELRAFLRSMPDHRNSAPFNLLKGLFPDESPFAEMTKEIEIDEKRAQDILKAELINLAVSNVVPTHNDINHVDMSIVRGEFFDFVMSPREPEHLIFAVLGYHLKSSGIASSMLRRCPRCTKVFIASRKPRADRNLYCDRKCSGNDASETHRRRTRVLLPKAKSRVAAGQSIDVIPKLTPTDREWLIKKLKLDSAGKLKVQKKNVARPPKRKSIA